MNFQNTNSGFFIWPWELNLSIKSTRSEEGWVKNVRPISGSDDLDIITLRETVKLVQKFQHSSMDLSGLTFSGTSFGANSIKLIDENYCWGFFPGEIKSIFDHFGSVTDVHLDKLWTG